MNLVGTDRFTQEFNAETALRAGTLFRHSPHPISALLERCGSNPLQVLGTFDPLVAPDSFDPLHLVARTFAGSRYPYLHCPNSPDILVQIVIYDRPDPKRMQYLSLKPIALALEDKVDAAHNALAPGSVEEAEDKERQRKAALVDKLRWHSVVKHPRTPKEKALPLIVEQINCSAELAALMEKNIGLIGTRLKRSLSVSERVVESASNLWDIVAIAIWQVLTLYIFPVMLQGFKYGLTAHRAAGEILLRVLEWRPFPESAALKDVSATFQQVDIRLQQFCYWPTQYYTLRKRKRTWQSITNSHPEYIRFYNSLWLVANDVIIGIALGSYIIDNATLVAQQIDLALSVWTVEGLQRMIFWLMDWPAGLKLNTELAKFLGDLFLWVIEYWAGTLFVTSFAKERCVDSHRMRVGSPPIPASHHTVSWLFSLRWRHDAHRTLLRPPVVANAPHLLVLRGIGEDLQLAAYHHSVAFPPLPRPETERVAQPH